jgi:hypothetical protein
MTVSVIGSSLRSMLKYYTSVRLDIVIKSHRAIRFVSSHKFSDLGLCYEFNVRCKIVEENIWT